MHLDLAPEVRLAERAMQFSSISPEATVSSMIDSIMSIGPLSLQQKAHYRATVVP